MAEVVGVHEAVARRMGRTEPEQPARQSEHQSGQHARAAGAEGLDAREHRAEDEQRPGAEQHQWHQVGGASQQEAEPVGEGATDPPAVPAEVEDKREERRERDQPQADQVKVTLLELRHAQRDARQGARRAPVRSPSVAAAAGHGCASGFRRRAPRPCRLSAG